METIKSDMEFEELLQQARTLDVDAIAQIYELYYPNILKFMYYRVDKNVAEDLTNDVFLKVMRSISKQKGRFAPWIFKIARNVIIDRARHLQAKPEASLEQDMVEKLYAKQNVEDGLVKHLDIESGLAFLNDDQREIIVLRFLQGLSCDEVSEITGLSSGAVRVAQLRALKKLKEVMSKHEK